MGTDCPTTLRGVTKINMGDSLITLHHHLTQPRLPCGRCYAPFHTTGFCKANPSQLERSHTKYCRRFDGRIPNYQVGAAVLYKHSDGDSLASFLETLQGEVTDELATSPRSARLEKQDVHSVEGAPVATTEIADRATRRDDSIGAQTKPRSSSGPSEATHLQHQDYEVAKSKSSKNRDAKQARKQQAQEGAGAKKSMVVPNLGPSTNVAQREAPPPISSGRAASGSATSRHAKANNKGNRIGRRIQLKQPAFTSFTRARAQGRFAAIDDDGASCDGENSDLGADDAPYAYNSDPEPRMALANHTPESLRPETSPNVSALTRGQDSSMVGGHDGSDMDCDDDASVSGYVGSSAPSHTQSPASTPGSEFPFSIDSDLEEEKHRLISNPESVGPSIVPDPQDEAASLSQSEMVTTESPTLSQDGFEMERIVHAPGMPQQLPTFLIPFAGSLVTVPANGQCAYAALYPSTAHVEGHRLQFTSDVVRSINVIKRSIYTLMMSNLAQDVECGVVDPSRELERLYPSQPPPKDPASATAALYNHYGHERSRSANTQIPSEFWAGAEVLRAMAQYLREPLLVLDVTANNDAHLQRYYYQEYRLKSGDVHESGCGGSMADVDAKLMLQQYARLHVLPVLIVLKKHERHYYGVQHGGLAVRWHAEGDHEFAETNCDSHPWISEVLAHIEASVPKLAGVDPLHDLEEVNNVIIGGMEHRERLDIIHDRLCLPRLDGECVDLVELDARLGAEGDRLHRAAGPQVTAALSARSDNGGSLLPINAKRGPISSHGRVAEVVMGRILDSIRLEPELLAD
ncbi:hypothetical protein PF005_g22588 [Phytophthora fragariae]|uniref:OTU domain-containing protein n=2 Tax=Phytophthora fragariae TaxID=53985 RepID=A0A6A3WGZ2_9STRA|nr:hypothetical protein PF003_g36172 [Phytophthora fragariae]KAE9182194.1 hypothetical protein PF005_g22588 [Phytophthora fragariae]KAE9285823.1 hypothetical protein PF001_g21734 [Phytophthora fragariae]